VRDHKQLVAPSPRIEDEEFRLVLARAQVQQQQSQGQHHREGRQQQQQQRQQPTSVADVGNELRQRVEPEKRQQRCFHQGPQEEGSNTRHMGAAVLDAAPVVVQASVWDIHRALVAAAAVGLEFLLQQLKCHHVAAAAVDKQVLDLAAAVVVVADEGEPVAAVVVAVAPVEIAIAGGIDAVAEAIAAVAAVVVAAAAAAVAAAAVAAAAEVVAVTLAEW
jgi:hypothetical protein